MDINDNDPLFLNKETNMSVTKPTEISPIRETIHYRKTQTEISYTPEYVKPKIDYTRAPTTGSFVMATCPRTGKTLYLPKQTQAKSKNKKNDLYKQIVNQSNKGNLLPTPISTLMKNIERQNQEKLKKIEREIETDKKQKQKKRRNYLKKMHLVHFGWIDINQRRILI
ncbi:unnamed protein product [Rhizopus stolonifer]